MTIITIARHELRRLYLSPLAWIIMALMQFLLAMVFFTLLNNFQQLGAQKGVLGITNSVVAGDLQSAGLLFLLATPFLTMRLFSEERRSGTLTLLLSAPVSITELVLGKFLGMVIFNICLLLMIALMPLSLNLGTSIDPGQYACGLLGLFLLMCSITAIGMFVSTLSRQPTVAAASTFGVIFLLWIIHIAGATGNEHVSLVFSYLSLLQHFNNLLSGMFSSVDVIYYLLVIGTFILLGIWRLDGLRTWS